MTIPKKTLDAFIEHLTKMPVVARACEATGISRNTVYKMKRQDEDFAARWEEAIENGLDRAEEVVFEIIDEGQDDAVRLRAATWQLSRRRPEIYGDRPLVSINAENIEAVEVVSPNIDEWSEIASEIGEIQHDDAGSA